MKKYLALFLTLVLVGAMCSLWVIAEEDTTPITDGFEFDIANVDTTVVAEKGLILTSQEAYNKSSTGWAINILCEKVADNLYKAKQDAVFSSVGQLTALTLEEDDIVISIHSDGVGANKDQKKQAMKVKAGMYFTLIDIDLSNPGAVTGKAKVNVNNPQEPAPDPDKETITVDGKFNDNGWKTDGWTHVDSANGRWQTALAEGETRSENYDFQFRTDDSNLYAALKINSKPLGKAECFGNGNGSNLRLWIFNDGAKVGDTEYTIFNSFLNIAFKDGENVLTAKKQNTPDKNDSTTLVDMDVTGVEVKSTYGDDYWYVEASIPFTVIGATSGTHVFITYSAPLSIGDDNNAVKNNALVFGQYGATAEKPNDFAPYNKWDSDADVDLVFADIKLGTIDNSGDNDDDYDLVTSEPLEEPAYELALSTKPEKYWPNTEITVCVTIKNIVPDAGIGLIQFKLYYDKTKVEPIVKNDGDSNAAMDDFLKKSPDLETWKKGAICQIFEEDGYYDISYLTDKNTGLAKEDGSIEIEIPFKVKADVNSSIVFQIPHGEDGTMGADVNTDPVYGNGGKVLVKRSATDPTASTSSSTSSASQATSSTTTSTLPTGDAGTYAIAIVAMVALAGAATVAVKKRNR